MMELVAATANTRKKSLGIHSIKTSSQKQQLQNGLVMVVRLRLMNIQRIE